MERAEVHSTVPMGGVVRDCLPSYPGMHRQETHEEDTRHTTPHSDGPFRQPWTRGTRAAPGAADAHKDFGIYEAMMNGQDTKEMLFVAAVDIAMKIIGSPMGIRGRTALKTTFAHTNELLLLRSSQEDASRIVKYIALFFGLLPCNFVSLLPFARAHTSEFIGNEPESSTDGGAELNSDLRHLRNDNIILLHARKTKWMDRRPPAWRFARDTRTLAIIGSAGCTRP